MNDDQQVQMYVIFINTDSDVPCSVIVVIKKKSYIQNHRKAIFDKKLICPSVIKSIRK